MNRTSCSMGAMNDQSLTVPAWRGEFGAKETVYYANDEEARVEIQYELVPSSLYVYVRSAARDGEEVQTRYRVREVTCRSSGFVQASPSTFSAEWPWDQLSQWPTESPLEATLWLDSFRTSMSEDIEPHHALLNQWLRGDVSSYYVKSLYVRPQL